MTDELKPCPFCASEQVTTSPCETITDDERPEVTWTAICKACGARQDRDTEAEAIAAWNTRAALTALPEIEELRNALDDLRRWAAVLHQNSVGCAHNHYGDDFAEHGMPGWLRDAEAAIVRAQDLIAQGQHK